MDATLYARRNTYRIFQRAYDALARQPQAALQHLLSWSRARQASTERCQSRESAAGPLGNGHLCSWSKLLVRLSAQRPSLLGHWTSDDSQGKTSQENAPFL